MYKDSRLAGFNWTTTIISYCLLAKKGAENMWTLFIYLFIYNTVNSSDFIALTDMIIMSTG